MYKVIRAKECQYEQEIIPHPRPQLLMETGIGHHASEERNSKEDGSPHIQSRGGTENRECNLESTIREKVRFIWFSQTDNRKVAKCPNYAKRGLHFHENQGISGTGS